MSGAEYDPAKILGMMTAVSFPGMMNEDCEEEYLYNTLALKQPPNIASLMDYWKGSG